MRIQFEIHEKALEIVSRYKRAEADLIDILQKADEHRVYLQLECKNLHEYTMKVLKLSESVAFNFIVVAGKAKEVPELKQAIQSGHLSVSKARKITAVLTKENQNTWLKMAIEMPQKKLEQQVAQACPKEATPEKLKFVSGDRLNLKMGISEMIHQKLKRAQDLESQRRKTAVSLEETLESLLDVYLEKHDPVKSSERLKTRKNLAVARQVDLRDCGQCTYTDSLGIRCAERRWLHSHHIIPKSKGGPDTAKNLTTLCSGHHRLIHSH
jgi:5-methylcytosine-specific restriction endonuclease McrA